MNQICFIYFDMSGEKQNYRLKRREQREGYEPSVSVKNVSISHCPPGGGREGRSDEEEETKSE